MVRMISDPAYTQPFQSHEDDNIAQHGNIALLYQDKKLMRHRRLPIEICNN